jgi:Tfp pilus assembly protein FimT
MNGRAGLVLAQLSAVDRNLRHRFGAVNGFTLIDVVTAAAVLSILSAMAVPLIRDVLDGMKLGNGARQVERELQTARLKAVSSNRPMRVRFNCPVAGQYRMVELVGTPSTPAAADSDGNRCKETLYPYPAADREPVTLPNNDGPIRRLDAALSFGSATKALEFWPDGSVHQDNGAAGGWPVLTGTGTSITLIKGSSTKSITVNGIGKIQIQ